MPDLFSNVYGKSGWRYLLQHLEIRHAGGLMLEAPAQDSTAVQSLTFDPSRGGLYRCLYPLCQDNAWSSIEALSKHGAVAHRYPSEDFLCPWDWCTYTKPGFKYFGTFLKHIRISHANDAPPEGTKLVHRTGSNEDERTAEPMETTSSASGPSSSSHVRAGKGALSGQSQPRSEQNHDQSRQKDIWKQIIGQP